MFIVGHFSHTLLQAAVASGELELIFMFLSEEIDVNSEGGKYGTALQTALAGYLQRKKYNDDVKEETLPIIHHLILKGVHIDARVGRIKDGTAFILFRSG
jgi:hypothetical protein